MIVSPTHASTEAHAPTWVFGILLAHAQRDTEACFVKQVNNKKSNPTSCSLKKMFPTNFRLAC